jgi:hypothetical protein
MSSIPLLLTNNINNYDLIDYFVNNATMPLGIRPDEIVDRTLILSTVDGLEKCKGVVITEGVTYTKEETRNYTSALVSDQTFITNLTYFINMFRIDIPLTTVSVDGTNYQCNSYISLSGKLYYILTSVPLTN